MWSRATEENSISTINTWNPGNLSLIINTSTWMHAGICSLCPQICHKAACQAYRCLDNDCNKKQERKVELKHIFKWYVKIAVWGDRKIFWNSPGVKKKKTTPYWKAQWKDLEPQTELSQMQMVSEVLRAGGCVGVGTTKQRCVTRQPPSDRRYRTAIPYL